MKYYFCTYFIVLGILLFCLTALVFHFTPPFYQAAAFGASAAFLFGWVIPCFSYFTDKEPERDRVWYFSMFNKRYPSEVLIQVLICVICFVLYKVEFLPRFNCFFMPIAGMILITYLFEWFWVRYIVRKCQTDLTAQTDKTEQPEQTEQPGQKDPSE